MKRGTVGEHQGRTLNKTAVARKWRAPGPIRDRELRQAAERHLGDHTISWIPTGNTRAHGSDDTGDLASRREWPLRTVLILVFDDQHVREVNRTRMDFDQQLIVP